MPRRVKRKRPILLEDGTEAGGLEEYYDYIFPVCVGWACVCACVRFSRVGTAIGWAGGVLHLPMCVGWAVGGQDRVVHTTRCATCTQAHRPHPSLLRPAALQEEAAAAPNLKILEAAYRWKRQRTEGQDGGEEAAGA